MKQIRKKIKIPKTDSIRVLAEFFDTHDSTDFEGELVEATHSVFAKRPTMIRAGKTKEIRWSNGSWLFIDIGFSNRRKSCGLLIHNEHPKCLHFNQACAAILDYIAIAKRPINLVIEAPLSVAFDQSGNPTGRKIEKQRAETRYWYVGAGCAMMVSAMYLVRSIDDAHPRHPVRLFEGFVSFKTAKSNDKHDVLRLREVVKNAEKNVDETVGPEELKLAPSDDVVSAFRVAGLDCGVPPVIMCKSQRH